MTEGCSVSAHQAEFTGSYWRFLSASPGIVYCTSFYISLATLNERKTQKCTLAVYQKKIVYGFYRSKVGSSSNIKIKYFIFHYTYNANVRKGSYYQFYNKCH